MILKASKLKFLFLKILKECPYSEKYSTNDLISRNIQIFNVVHPPPFKTEFLNSEHFKFDLTILPPSKTSSSRLQSSNFCLPILFCSNLIFLSVKTLKNSQLNFLLLSFIQASFLSVFVFSWKLCLRERSFFSFIMRKVFSLNFFSCCSQFCCLFVHLIGFLQSLHKELEVLRALPWISYSSVAASIKILLKTKWILSMLPVSYKLGKTLTF